MRETSTLRSRLRSAAIAIPLVVAPVIVGGPILATLVALCAAIAAAEGATMFYGRGLRPPAKLAAPLAGLLVVATARPDVLPIARLLPIVVAAWLLAVVWRRFGRTAWRKATLEATLAVAAAFYVGGLLRYALPLRDLPHGLAWAAVVLMGTWGADTAGYFVGRRWGRRRLAPGISPGKTWEGALAGLAIAIAAAAVVAPWLDLGSLRTLALGLLIGVSAITGDLFESALKRLARVKDAGQLLPGHGGLLDRIDSLLFVVAATDAFAMFFAAP